MLHGMAALVGGNGSGGDGAAGIDALAEVDGVVGGVVVVGELAGGGDDADVIYAVVVEHLLGHLAAGHAAGERLFAVLLKLALQVGLDQITEDGHSAKDDKVGVHNGEREIYRDRERGW